MHRARWQGELAKRPLLPSPLGFSMGARGAYKVQEEHGQVLVEVRAANTHSTIGTKIKNGHLNTQVS